VEFFSKCEKNFNFSMNGEGIQSARWQFTPSAVIMGAWGTSSPPNLTDLKIFGKKNENFQEKSQILLQNMAKITTLFTPRPIGTGGQFTLVDCPLVCSPEMSSSINYPWCELSSWHSVALPWISKIRKICNVKYIYIAESKPTRFSIIGFSALKKIFGVRF
jgi:hypothetical protein